MIYISKKNFKIVHSINTLNEQEYFECDELIAPAISSFNKKGYETAFCCSGHVAPVSTDTTYSDEFVPVNGLYVTFKKVNPNKNLLKFLKSSKLDLLKEFNIIVEKCNPCFLFTIEHDLGKNLEGPFTGDTRQVAEIYKELLDINQKLFEIARKIPHKRQLNKSFHRVRKGGVKNGKQ